MTLYSDTLVEKNGWEVVHIELKYDDSRPKEDSEHYVLKHRTSSGDISIPFTHIIASGGIIEFWRCDNLDVEYVDIRSEGNRTGGISDVLTGSNTLKDDTDMPDKIYHKLKEIGPW